MSRRPLTSVAAAGLGVLLAAGLLGGCAAEPPEPSSAGAGLGTSEEASTTVPVPEGLPPVLADAVRRAPGAPPRATSPADAVDQVVAASQALDDRTSSPRVQAAAGHLEQVAYRELGARPSWDGRVRALLKDRPERLRQRVADNVASRRQFIDLQGGFRSDTLPAWRIVRPLPADRLVQLYLEAEDRFGVGWEYLAAINLLETGMGRIVGNSVAGAQGPMQFIPETWARYGLGGDVRDPRDAIMGAANYLAARGFTEPGGIPDALFSYNNDVRYVRGVTRVANVMERDPRAFLGYYHWEIYYVSTAGDVRLPRGYDRDEPVPVSRYLRSNPRS